MHADYFIFCIYELEASIDRKIQGKRTKKIPILWGSGWW